MNKINIFIISIITIMVAIITAVIIYNPEERGEKEERKMEIAQEEILDECTDEYEEIQSQMLEANYSEEKISPNCFITLKRLYKQCGHIKNEHFTISEELVNKSEKELKDKYDGWKIEKFSDTDIVLSKEEEGECGEHFIVRDNDGKVTIYEILQDGSEHEYELTDISTEYLTPTDKINMKNGIKVNGKQDLNQLIEDFE